MPDYPSGQIWGLHVSDTPKLPARVVLVHPGDQLPSWGEDLEPLAGELVSDDYSFDNLRNQSAERKGLSDPSQSSVAARSGLGSGPKAATATACYCCCLLFFLFFA